MWNILPSGRQFLPSGLFTYLMNIGQLIRLKKKNSPTKEQKNNQRIKK